MKKNGRYTIEELSGMTGFSRRTIRYYVSEGLIPPPAGRGMGGYYFDSHLGLLKQIASLRKNGLKLAQIRALLEPEPIVNAQYPACAGEPESDSLVRYHLAPGVELLVSGDVDRARGKKIRDLARLARSVLAKGK